MKPAIGFTTGIELLCNRRGDGTISDSVTGITGMMNSMKYTNRENTRTVIVVEENELNEGKFTFRDMK
ncbi:MAG: hypothetical protein JJU13_04875 [Balneolaceae bacterium]|nr:hypothetical protein [Balneolaceae bacterium]